MSDALFSVRDGKKVDADIWDYLLAGDDKPDPHAVDLGAVVTLSYREKLERLSLDWDEELHPRDEAGQFTGGEGGEGGSGGGDNIESHGWDLEGPERRIYSETGNKAVAKSVVSVAGAFGVPLDKVTVRDLSARRFTLNGRSFATGGYFSPQTGQVHLDSSMSTKTSIAVLSHELSHYVFHEASDSNTPEGHEFKEFLTVFADELKAEDGVTPYSSEYWKQLDDPALEKREFWTTRAVNETLAEVSSLKVREKVDPEALKSSDPSHPYLITTEEASAHERQRADSRMARGAATTSDIRNKVRDPAERVTTHTGKPVASVWHEAHRLMFKASDAERKVKK